MHLPGGRQGFAQIYFEETVLPFSLLHTPSPHRLPTNATIPNTTSIQFAIISFILYDTPGITALLTLQKTLPNQLQASPIFHSILPGEKLSDR